MFTNKEYSKGPIYSKITGWYMNIRRKNHSPDNYEPLKRIILLIVLVVSIVVTGTKIGLF